MIRRVKKLIIVILWLVSFTSFVPYLTYAQNSQWWFWATVWISGIQGPWTEKNQEDSLINTIKTAVNWVLGMLSLVALVLCLYAWFKMLTSWWDSKKYGEWFAILKNAAIWLAVIALSWLIVSLVFWIINWAIWWAWVWNE